MSSGARAKWEEIEEAVDAEEGAKYSALSRPVRAMAFPALESSLKSAPSNIQLYFAEVKTELQTVVVVVRGVTPDSKTVCPLRRKSGKSRRK